MICPVRPTIAEQSPDVFPAQNGTDKNNPYRAYYIVAPGYPVAPYILRHIIVCDMVLFDCCFGDDFDLFCFIIPACGVTINCPPFDRSAGALFFLPAGSQRGVFTQKRRFRGAFNVGQLVLSFEIFA
jgi:hypothetical protein